MRRARVTKTLAPVGPQGPPVRRAARLVAVARRARGSLLWTTGTSCASPRPGHSFNKQTACHSRAPSRQSSGTTPSPGQACHQEWLAFLKTIDAQTPTDLDIHIIADNYATHKHAAVTRWLDRHPRFHMHDTPTASSWMNLVERFFRDLTEFITEKSFASTRELADAIIAFLAARNENPRRYLWNAKGEDILRKINGARVALAAAPPKSNAISETAHQAAGILPPRRSSASTPKGGRSRVSTRI
jgi:transposase